jgi:hypothetical protein
MTLKRRVGYGEYTHSDAEESEQMAVDRHVERRQKID